MDLNINTQHTLHCTAMAVKSQKSFSNPKPPQRTVAVALDMSKGFDALNIHKLIHKLTLTAECKNCNMQYVGQTKN